MRVGRSTGPAQDFPRALARMALFTTVAGVMMVLAAGPVDGRALGPRAVDQSDARAGFQAICQPPAEAVDDYCTCGFEILEMEVDAADMQAMIDLYAMIQGGEVTPPMLESFATEHGLNDDAILALTEQAERVTALMDRYCLETE